jgi:hypothetical protein
MLSQRLVHRAPAYAQLRLHHLYYLQTRYNSSQAEAKFDLRTTVPAPLNLPVRQPGQGIVGHLYATGKAYLAFYRTGLHHVFLNYRTARAIERSLRAKCLTVSQAIDEGHLTRTQFQLLHRNRHDIRRVPIFALVCLCCGELTPLVVLLLANQVPWTCLTPRQVQKYRQRQADARARSGAPPPAVTVSALSARETPQRRSRREELLQVSGVLGLHGRWWRPPTAILQRRLRRHVDYLETDDRLIISRNEAGPSEWPLVEVEWALVDRGICVLGKSEEELRRALDRWLLDRKDHGLQDHGVQEGVH